MNIKELVQQILSRDSVENYGSAEEVCESVTSEIEARREITPADAAAIGEMCEEWFAYEQ